MNHSKPTTVLLGILVLIASGVIFFYLRGILRPFFVAVFLSILLDPLVELLRKIKIPKAIAVFIVLIFTFAFLFLLGLIVYASITSFSDELPKYEAKFTIMFQNILRQFNIPLESLNTYLQQFDWKSAIKDLSLPSFISSGVGTFFQFLINVFLVILFMIYILLGKDSFFDRIRRAFETDGTARVTNTVQNINDEIQKYLIVKTIISLITGILATVVLLIFGVDFAIVWGMLTFLLNFIPSVGSTIATIPPILLALLQFDSLMRPLWVAVSLLVIQMTMGNFVEPKFMGKHLDLSPLIVILFLIFWGYLWGIVGMILAVPIAATIKIVTANIRSLRPISVFMGGT